MACHIELHKDLSSTGARAVPVIRLLTCAWICLKVLLPGLWCGLTEVVGSRLLSGAYVDRGGGYTAAYI